MKAKAYTILIFIVLFATATQTTSVYALSINAQVEITQRLDVLLEFKNLAQYEEIYGNGEIKILNETKNAIEGYLAQRKLSGYVSFDVNPVVFDNETKSVKIAFHMAGADVFHTEVNTEKANKLCKVRTDWRNIRLSLSETAVFDLSRYFGIPVSQWQNSTDNEGRMRFASPTVSEIPESSFSFTLPASAKNIHFAADRDTILFELPLNFEDQLLNSPILILIVLIAIVCILTIYNKITK